MDKNKRIRMLEFGDEPRWRILLNQLNSQKILQCNISQLLKDPNFCGLVIEVESDVVAFGSISFIRSSFKGITGVVEDVVVDQKYRGQKLGSMLFDALLTEAEKRKANCITLTSSPGKVTARRLYESRGFVLRETGFFVKG